MFEGFQTTIFVSILDEQDIAAVQNVQFKQPLPFLKQVVLKQVAFLLCATNDGQLSLTR
jgi:hypothetical protein